MALAVAQQTIMDARNQPELVRAMGRWTLVALVLNSIIGSGIFGLPSIVAGLLGGAAPLAYIAASWGIAIIMACFAEVASRFREPGGPYLYARVAFGRFAGIEIAWLTWLARLTAAAGNANLFVIYLAGFWPRASEPLPRLAVLTLLLGLLAAVNYYGVGAGARLSDAFAVSKLLPLAAFIVVGLFFLRVGNFSLHPAGQAASGGPGPWMDAVLILMFAFGGFEGALIPMSEARDPRRDAPFALFVALGVSTLFYALVQVVVTGVLSAPQQTDRPLAEAALHFMGAPGAALITLGALISVYGNLSSMTLYTPRLTFALAEHRDFPRAFASVHPRFRTPHVSILVYSLLVWGLAAAGSFRWNATLSAVARLFTYGFTCAALPVLRRRRSADAFLRLPGGRLLAVAGVVLSSSLVSRMGRSEFEFIAGTAVVALLNWLWAQRRVSARR
jgi:basic amino acid/polyamine antiporter, APA family